jgi:ADP-heptose:LPS heptosyltransferase
MQSNTEITHNLDRFRGPFVGHPGNYIDIYSSLFRITDPNEMALVRQTPWLTVPETKKIPGRTVVINRTERWLPTTPSPQWAKWKSEGMEQAAVFVGLPNEYEEFKRVMGWDLPHYQTPNMLDIAEIIAGCDLFIGNQSSALAIAIGLGVDVICEARRDLPPERNECYFSDIDRIKYI